jgi:hypothetical protein
MLAVCALQRLTRDQGLPSSDQSFYGLPFGVESPVYTLIRLSRDNGTCMEICRYDTSVRCGVDIGAGVFVTATGEVVSLLNGRILRQLAFPARDATWM